MEPNNPRNGATENRTIYRRAADDGLWMGVYFIVLFVFMVASLSNQMFNVPLLAGVLAVPFLTYFFLRRTHVAAHGMTSFSAIWMQGIVTFGCGCLIFCCAAFVYMRWIAPDFILRIVRMAADLYASSPSEEARAVAADFQQIIDKRLIPSPLTIVLGWLWLGMFTGSILSLIVAIFVRARKVPLSS